MARKILVAFFFSFVCILVVGPYVPNVDARTQKMLKTRTQLRPVAWSESKEKPWFAPGPYWVDEFGGVQSGTLDEIRRFEIWNGNGRSLSFGKGLIRFERSAGGVKEGTLVSGITLPVVNTGGRNNQNISLAPGTTVEFGYDAGVMVGTLNVASSYYPQGMTTLKNYPKGTVLYFTGAGEVKRFVLPTGEPTDIDGLYEGTCNCDPSEQVLRIPFSITARNGVFEGVSEVEKTCHLNYKGNYTKKGVITNGSLTGWADINHWRDRDQNCLPHCGLNHYWIVDKSTFGLIAPRQGVPPPTPPHYLRWTVQGPIKGMFPSGLVQFRMTATSIDGCDIKHFTCTGTKAPAANIATSVVLLLDLSGSMKGQKLSDAKAAAKKMIRKMPANFEIGIMTYEGACGQIFPFMSFTQDKQKLENAIDSLTTGGGTPLSDALTQAAEAIRKVGSGKQGKIILLCDGEDSCNGDLVGEATLIGRSIGVKMPKKGGKTSSVQTRFWAHLNSEYWKGALGPRLAWAADPAGFTRTDFKKLQASSGRQKIPIKIYTVGLKVNKSQQKVLDNIATAGGGTSASAENMEELTKAFNDAIIDKPPTPAPAKRDEWQSLRQNTSPPPASYNPQPSPPKPPADDGWEPIGGSSSSTTRGQSGSSEEQRNIPKGHSTKYGF